MSDTLEQKTWIEAGAEADFPEGLGICIQHDALQIAVFHFNADEWYAVQNQSPYNGQMVLSRGLTGTQNGEPKIACPLHKHTFSLRTGEYLGEGELPSLATYAVKRDNGRVYLQV